MRAMVRQVLLVALSGFALGPGFASARPAQDARQEAVPDVRGEWKGVEVVRFTATGTYKGEDTLRITEQDGPYFRGTRSYRIPAGKESANVGGRSVREATEPILGVIDFDNRTLRIAEQGDGGRIDAVLADARTLRGTYVESGDNARVIRFTYTKVK